MQKTKGYAGHFAAMFTVLVWGTTFVATKVLLESFTPIEILLLRFLLGTLALFLIRPKRLRLKEKKHHLYFLGAGISGVTLYFLMENIALTYTNASNVGVLVAVSPLITAVLMRIVYKGRLHPVFFVGFACAAVGIYIISFSGGSLSLNPTGDILALLAAACWSCYSMFTRKIGELGYDNILATRRIFLYGIAFMLPAALVMGFSPSLAAFANPVNIANLLYLGFGASALCFVVWNFAVRSLGTIKTSAYIYAVPVVSVVSSAIILGERITPLICLGILLTLAGLILSEWVGHQKTTVKEKEKDFETAKQ